MGEPGDYEVRCARQVARVLGWSHQIATVQTARFPETAALHAAWDHLGSGFSSPHLWGMIEPLRAFGPRIMTGYLADLVIGGSALKPVSRTGRQISAVIFEWANHRGVPAGTLKRLLRREDLIAFVIESVQAEFGNASVPEQEKFWRYQLAATERLRVGGMPWRFSFGSWPVVPVLDRALLDAVATLPVDSMVNRRAQDEILRTRFPKLARVPHVLWNADVQLPLLPTFGQRLRHRLNLMAQRIPLKRPDRRYTWRMYDFNGPGWQLIRRRAEPSRERLGAWFDPDTLAEYLPPPDVPVASPTFESTMGRKLLVGLMLWAETHLT
jgi:asparagine synthase (glutamine-hydrolysing)